LPLSVGGAASRGEQAGGKRGSSAQSGVSPPVTLVFLLAIALVVSSARPIGLPVADGHFRSLRAETGRNPGENGSFRLVRANRMGDVATTPFDPAAKNPRSGTSPETRDFQGFRDNPRGRPKSNGFGRSRLNDVSCPPATGSPRPAALRTRSMRVIPTAPDDLRGREHLGIGDAQGGVRRVDCRAEHGVALRSKRLFPLILQRSAKELNLRRFPITPLQLGQEYWPVLLGARLPHDRASVSRLGLARRFSGGAIGQ
jgi:hypothetical protein